jgi:transposase-like protein
MSDTMRPAGQPQLRQRGPGQNRADRRRSVKARGPGTRRGTFEPQIVKERQQRLTGVDDMVLLLLAKGLTQGEISAHPAEVHGAEVSKLTAFTITTQIMDCMAAWQSCPLDKAGG